MARRASQQSRAAAGLGAVRPSHKRGFNLSIRPELLAALKSVQGKGGSSDQSAGSEASVIKAFLSDVKQPKQRGGPPKASRKGSNKAARPPPPPNSSSSSSSSASRRQQRSVSTASRSSRREALGGGSRKGSGRRTTPRAFSLTAQAPPPPPPPPPEQAPPADAEEQGATETPRRPPPVSVRMRVVKRPRQGSPPLPPIPLGSASARPPPRTPAPPQSLLKARGCWYLEHSSSPSASQHKPASSGPRTPSTLAKAPGCWYSYHAPPSGGTPPSPSSFRAPSSQAQAKGCWYLDHPGETPAPPPRGRRLALALPPRPPSTIAKAPGAWYAFEQEAEGSTSVHQECPAGAEDSEAAATGARAGRAKKAVSFEASGTTPQAVLEHRLPPADAGAGAQACGGKPPPAGVLTELRNVYHDAGGPGSASAAASTARKRGPPASADKWRVDLGPGMSPYIFSPPVPVRLNAGEEPPEEEEEDGGKSLEAEVDMDLAESDEEGLGAFGPEGHSNPSMGTQCGTPLPGLGTADCGGGEEEDEDEGEEEEEGDSSGKAQRRRASAPNQRLRKAASSSRTPGMIGAGTKTVDGVRRSSRVRYQPLEFWRNEYKEYCRTHTSLPTVASVHMRTPDSAWPGNKPKAKARVSKPKKQKQ